MRFVPGVPLVALGLAAAPALAAQPISARPQPTPRPNAALADVSRYYDAMEQNVEVQFAKLKKQAKDDIDALESKIKEIDRQIASLKERAGKIVQIAAKMDALLPKFMAALGRDTGGRTGRAASSKRDQVAAQLRTELAGLGVVVSPDQLSKIVDGLEKGGRAGMAQAVFLCTAIAEADLKRIDDQLGSAAAAKQDQKTRIAALDKQLAKLEADRQKAIAALKAQKEKALKNVPTATPTPSPRR